MCYNLRLVIVIGLIFCSSACNQQYTSSTPTRAVTPRSPVTPTTTPTRIPTQTNTPTQTPQQVVRYTSTPTVSIDPDLAFLFLKDGRVFRYFLANQLVEPVQIPATGQISSCTLSPTGKYLACRDDAGLSLLDRTNDEIDQLTTSRAGWAEIFSADEEFLAFNDLEGLKLVNLEDKQPKLLVEHILFPPDDPALSPEENPYNHWYFPDEWSPDNQWLVIGLSSYEGWPDLSLLHLPTGKIFDFTDCGSSPNWSDRGDDFVLSVSYDGFSGCGENDGIYQIVPSKDGVIEQRIYQNTLPMARWERDYGDAIYIQGGEVVSFVETSGQGSSVNIMRQDGSNRQKIAYSSSRIYPIEWSEHGNRLIYANEQGIYTLDLTDLKNRLIAPIGSQGYRDLFLSPDENWLLIGASWELEGRLHALNFMNEHLTSIDIEFDQFIGWEPLK